LDRSEDADILEFARKDRRVCITLDHDFHAHLALTRSGDPSVVLLRVEGLDAAEQAALIRTICSQCEAALVEGAAISADSRTIRVRRLPLK
jgi:predicted nuclease of predicted toxin-antitoxin system